MIRAVYADGLLDPATGETTREAAVVIDEGRVTHAGKRAGTAPAAQDNLMSSGKRFTRNGKRNGTRSDRPDPHRPVPFDF